jgi:hypothetical protein
MLALGVGITWLCLHADTKPVRRGTVYRVPALTRTRRIGWLDPGRFDDPPERDWLPHPDWSPWLAQWDREVDGLPWGSAVTFAPVDVRVEVDDQGATIGRIIPDRPSTAMVRRIAAMEAA